MLAVVYVALVAGLLAGVAASPDHVYKGLPAFWNVAGLVVCGLALAVSVLA